MPVRAVLCGGVSTLQAEIMEWAQQTGFAEVEIVVNHGEIPSPILIHNAGIKVAGLNPYNDNWEPQRAEDVAGYAQSIASAGWDLISGEGLAGNIVTDIENHVPYADYHGAGGADGGQIDPYNTPWNHPRSGGKGHLDYVETYVGGGATPSVQSCINKINDAKSYGSIHYGPLIAMFNNYPCSYEDVARIIRETGSDSVVFWCGIINNAYTQFRTTFATGYFERIKSDFGLTASAPLGSPSSGGGGTSSNTPTNKLISLSFSDATKGETSRSVPVREIIHLTGKSGFKDAKGYWTRIPNPEQVRLWRTRTDRNDVEWPEDLGTQWPRTDGTFDYYVTWNKRESIKYKIGLAGSSTSAPTVVGAPKTVGSTTPVNPVIPPENPPDDDATLIYVPVSDTWWPNWGTGSSTYNARASNTGLYHMQGNGYPLWGDVTSTDFVCIPAGAATDNQNTVSWEIGFHWTGLNGQRYQKIWDKGVGAYSIYIDTDLGANLGLLTINRMCSSGQIWFIPTTTNIRVGHDYYIQIAWTAGATPAAGSTPYPVIYIGEDGNAPVLQTGWDETGGALGGTGTWYDDSVSSAEIGNYSSAGCLTCGTLCATWGAYWLYGHLYIFRQYATDKSDYFADGGSWSADKVRWA